jgi:hypothetical protein
MFSVHHGLSTHLPTVLVGISNQLMVEIIDPTNEWPADRRSAGLVRGFQTNRNRIYAIVDAKEVALSSNDAGATWTKFRVTAGSGTWLFNKVTADPKDADTVYVQNINLQVDKR